MIPVRIACVRQAHSLTATCRRRQARICNWLVLDTIRGRPSIITYLCCEVITPREKDTASLLYYSWSPSKEICHMQEPRLHSSFVVILSNCEVMARREKDTASLWCYIIRGILQRKMVICRNPDSIPPSWWSWAQVHTRMLYLLLLPLAWRKLVRLPFLHPYPCSWNRKALWP